MILTLVFDGQQLGQVEFGNASGNERQGMLRPGPAYDAARSALQSITLGTSTLPRGDAAQIRAIVMQRHAELAARGLCLVDRDGKRVPTRTLIVGDYLPADASPLPSGWPAVPVIAEFEDAATGQSSTNATDRSQPV